MSMVLDQQHAADVTVTLGEDFVATVELHRPPDNYFDRALIGALADAYQALDADPGCRAIVLCSEGKHFCAGADLAGGHGLGGGPGALYREAIRLFEAATPVVAAVQGAAIGGGLGLACSADFRVGCPQARFAANFARLGFHHGFGLSVTLPAIVGPQRSLELLYTGRRIGGDEAAADRPMRPAGARGRGPRRGTRPGRGDRGLGPAGRAVHPGHDARPPGRPGARGHRPGSRRAGPAAGNGRLARGHHAPRPSAAPRGSQGR